MTDEAALGDNRSLGAGTLPPAVLRPAAAGWMTERD